MKAWNSYKGRHMMPRGGIWDYTFSHCQIVFSILLLKFPFRILLYTEHSILVVVRCPYSHHVLCRVAPSLFRPTYTHTLIISIHHHTGWYGKSLCVCAVNQWYTRESGMTGVEKRQWLSIGIVSLRGTSVNSVTIKYQSRSKRNSRASQNGWLESR